MGRTPMNRRPYRSQNRPPKEQNDNVKPSIVDISDCSDKQPTFPRRFPRIGSQFQTKISKSNAQLSRPQPQLMSSDHPFITVEEVQNKNNKSVVFAKDQASPGIDSTTHQQQQQKHEPKSKRQQPDQYLNVRSGGTLIHKPCDDMDRFTRFSQPFFRSSDNNISDFATDQSWKQHMIQIHATTPKKPSRQKKRKYNQQKNKQQNSQEEDLIWKVEQLSQQSLQQQQNSHISPLPAEDDARAFQYLHCRHGGDAASAELSLMVELSAGQASKRRKVLQKELYKDRFKQFRVTSSEGWRKRYERTFLSIQEQLGENDKVKYPVTSKTSLAEEKTDTCMDIAPEDDDLRGAWRSVLSSAQTMERQLGADVGNGRKPLLSTVCSFVRNAYGLPTPEASFGTNHVIVEEVAGCLSVLLDHVDTARHVQAKLRDLLYDADKDGIEIDALQKFLDSSTKSLPVQLDEAEQLYKFVRTVSEWEGRLNAILDSAFGDGIDFSGRNDLAAVLQLHEEAKTHGFKSKSATQLKCRIQKAHTLRNRILKWKQGCANGKKVSLKVVSALVRDANRLKLIFPEVSELLAFQRKAECWIDRANIAIRSRISLTEIKSLMLRGQEMPLDFSDYMDKLNSRVEVAEEWIKTFEAAVPCPKNDDGSRNMLLWMKEMRTRLSDGTHCLLHDLASEGNRIPVEVDCVKLLQVELDAKNWSTKARKWIPNPETGEGKKGKLDDLRDHVAKATLLRDKLTLSDVEKQAWKLDGELELISIVEQADRWFVEYKPYLEGDNRKSQRRSCLPIKKLRQIVSDGNSIHANIGSATSKMTRILAQAESWFETHKTVLERCNIEPHLAGSETSTTTSTTKNTVVQLSDMVSAVDSASSGVSLDLDEALELKSLIQKVENWFNRAQLVAPKRGKRQGRSSRSKFTVDDLVQLINEAAALPVDTSTEVQRLQDQLDVIQTWKSRADQEMDAIIVGFNQLRENIKLAFGQPNEFSRKKLPKSKSEQKNDEYDMIVDSGAVKQTLESDKSNVISEDSSSQVDSISIEGSEEDFGYFGKSETNVHRMIKAFQQGSKSVGVVTTEAEICDALVSVSTWCLRSLKYLDSPREVFDKRFFGAFDRFMKEGKDLSRRKREIKSDDTQRKLLLDRLTDSWTGVVSDQLERLDILRNEREQFTKWCDAATAVLADEKKLTVEKITDLAEQSRDFPAVSEMVQKVRGLAVKATGWVESTRKLLKADKKMSLLDAKCVLETGEKLNVGCSELKAIRAAIRSARSWANKVKRLNLDQGATHVSTIKDLIKEHDSFIIEMPEELSKLKQATRNYCLCRRPYDGFMIGCDECEEWYHGVCICISESRADRFDKFVCIRCSIVRVFKSSASTIVGVLKKWTNRKDLKKMRQVEGQKHQRKVRKETKDIEKFRAEIDTIQKALQQQAIGGLTLDGTVVGHSDYVPGSVTETIVASLQSTNGIQPDGSVTDMDVDGEKDNTSDSDNAETSSNQTSTKSSSNNPADLRNDLERSLKALQQAEERLETLTKKTKERKMIQKSEDEKSASLKRWCIRVRSLVLVPRTAEQAQMSRPLKDGSLSAAMCNIAGDAEKLGISDFPDVEDVMNCFECMSWSLFTLSILKRKPTLSQLKSILDQASSIRLPDEKGHRTLKTIYQRATQWQAKVQKALAPKPGETKAINIDCLRDLLVAADEIPVRIPDTTTLQIVIEDKGCRHCFCGGPSDGTFMLGCDSCERWFHGGCVGITKEASEGIGKWICGGCSGKGQDYGATSPGVPALTTDVDSSIFCGDDDDDDEGSPHSPDVTKMWPPYGLLGSKEASEALGADCSAIPDDVCAIRAEVASVPPAAGYSSQNNLSQHHVDSSAIVAGGQALPVLSHSHDVQAASDVLSRILNNTRDQIALQDAEVALNRLGFSSHTRNAGNFAPDKNVEMVRAEGHIAGLIHQLSAAMHGSIQPVGLTSAAAAAAALSNSHVDGRMGDFSANRVHHGSSSIAPAAGGGGRSRQQEALQLHNRKIPAMPKVSDRQMNVARHKEQHHSSAASRDAIHGAAAVRPGHQNNGTGSNERLSEHEHAHALSKVVADMLIAPISES